MKRKLLLIVTGVAVVIGITSFCVLRSTQSDLQKFEEACINQKFDDRFDFSSNLLVVKSDKQPVISGVKASMQDGEYWLLQFEDREQTSNAFKELSCNYEVTDNAQLSISTESVLVTEEDTQFEQDSVNTTEQTFIEITDAFTRYTSKPDYTKQEVTIAVLDSGYSGNNQRVLQSDLNYSTSPGGVGDKLGHGTFITNMILNNTSDCVKVLPIKVVNNEGNASILSLSKGITKAVDSGVDIINVSITGYATNTSMLDQALAYADSKGVIVVTAAGNDHNNVQYYSPASSDKVITVAAYSSPTDSGAACDYSNYGDAIDVSAMGYCNAKDNTEQIVQKEGTSISAAYVSALLALHKSSGEDIQRNNFLSLIEEDSIEVVDSATKYCGKRIITLDCDPQKYPHVEFDTEVTETLLDFTPEEFLTMSSWRLNNLFRDSNSTEAAYVIKTFPKNVVERIKRDVDFLKCMTQTVENGEIIRRTYEEYLETIDISNYNPSAFKMKKSGYGWIKILHANGQYSVWKINITLVDVVEDNADGRDSRDQYTYEVTAIRDTSTCTGDLADDLILRGYESPLKECKTNGAKQYLVAMMSFTMKKIPYKSMTASFSAYPISGAGGRSNFNMYSYADDNPTSTVQGNGTSGTGWNTVTDTSSVNFTWQLNITRAGFDKDTTDGWTDTSDFHCQMTLQESHVTQPIRVNDKYGNTVLGAKLVNAVRGDSFYAKDLYFGTYEQYEHSSSDYIACFVDQVETFNYYTPKNYKVTCRDVNRITNEILGSTEISSPYGEVVSLSDITGNNGNAGYYYTGYKLVDFNESTIVVDSDESKNLFIRYFEPVKYKVKIIDVDSVSFDQHAANPSKQLITLGEYETTADYASEYNSLSYNEVPNYQFYSLLTTKVDSITVSDDKNKNVLYRYWKPETWTVNFINDFPVSTNTVSVRPTTAQITANRPLPNLEQLPSVTGYKFLGFTNKPSNLALSDTLPYIWDSTGKPTVSKMTQDSLPYKVGYTNQYNYYARWEPILPKLATLESVNAYSGNVVTFQSKILNTNEIQTNGLKYQWYVNNLKFEGGTDPSLTLTLEPYMDGLTIHYTVTTAQGAVVESNSAKLNIYYYKVEVPSNFSLTLSSGSYSGTAEAKIKIHMPSSDYVMIKAPGKIELKSPGKPSKFANVTLIATSIPSYTDSQTGQKVWKVQGASDGSVSERSCRVSVSIPSRELDGNNLPDNWQGNLVFTVETSTK